MKVLDSLISLNLFSKKNINFSFSSSVFKFSHFIINKRFFKSELIKLLDNLEILFIDFL